MSAGNKQLLIAPKQLVIMKKKSIAFQAIDPRAKKFSNKNKLDVRDINRLDECYLSSNSENLKWEISSRDTPQWNA